MQDDKELSKEVDYLLDKMKEAGYLTQRGTNTYTLAQIIVDYANRVADERVKQMSYLNFWETNDVAVAALIAYDRYRIYFPRPAGWTYRINDTFKNRKIGDSFLGVSRYVEDTAVLGDSVIKVLGKASDITGPVDLGVNYEDLLAGSVAEISGSRLSQIKNQNIFESFNDENGVYVEMDYVILPHNGKAMFVPTRSFEKETGSLKICVYTKPKDQRVENPYNIPLPIVKPAMDIDADYLRFVVTEMMSKFAVLNRLGENSFMKFIHLKYNHPVYRWDSREEQIVYIDLPEPFIEELQRFADANVIPAINKRWRISKPITASVFIYNESADPDLVHEINHYIDHELEGLLLTHAEIRPKAQTAIYNFLKSKYGDQALELAKAVDFEIDVVYGHGEHPDDVDEPVVVMKPYIEENCGCGGE